MKESIVKNILKKIIGFIKHGMSLIYQRRQSIVYVLMIVVATTYLVYVLGYSSNWALVVSDTRGGAFYRASQKANQLMFQLAFVLVVANLLSLGFGSMSRKKFYLSNMVFSAVSIVLTIVSGVVTFYYNGVLSRMYARIPEEEVPQTLYQIHGAGAKSFQVFEIGNILVIIMMAVAILALFFLIGKIRAQKERSMLIQRMVNHHEC